MTPNPDFKGKLLFNVELLNISEMVKIETQTQWNTNRNLHTPYSVV